ncbi:Hypothetical predicted protein [Cloeon dipterum]|uniref:Uncharacterized protein n=1 Tax=Cloeon dipterum TaxID=197152 RepID=A0A8S1DZF8_9INSE|nr:Hypothetical predicted protein [Cloeon dipterum]
MRFLVLFAVLLTVAASFASAEEATAGVDETPAPQPGNPISPSNILSSLQNLMNKIRETLGIAKSIPGLDQVSRSEASEKEERERWEQKKRDKTSTKAPL